MPAKVLVTGANGHVGSNLAKELRAKGYQVRASVRDASDPARTAHLAEAGITDIISLDVRDGERFRQASASIDILFHVAATYRYHTGSRQADEEMIRDSIEGATAAVRAAHANNIGKLVLTSSAVTLPLTERGGPPVGEEEWRTDLGEPYFRAKTLAEKEAWRLAAELGVNLVSVLPGAIIGPGFLKRTASTNAIEGIMLGAMRFGAPNSNMPLIDIRDVVSAHILAAEKDCTGRFAITGDRAPTFFEIARMMHAIDPAIAPAPRTLPDFAMKAGVFFDWFNAAVLGAPRTLNGAFIRSVTGREWAMSNAKARKELGWSQQIPLERSLADTIATLRTLRQREAANRAAR